MTEKELQRIVQIAHENIPELEGRPDLEAQNNDSEDFFETSVWSVKDALIAAYELGKATGQGEEAEEETETGEWFVSEYEYLTCSKCGESYYTGADSTAEAYQRIREGKFYPFCPHCGNPMGSVLNQ